MTTITATTTAIKKFLTPAQKQAAEFLERLYAKPGDFERCVIDALVEEVGNGTTAGILIAGSLPWSPQEPADAMYVVLNRHQRTTEARAAVMVGELIEAAEDHEEVAAAVLGAVKTATFWAAR